MRMKTFLLALLCLLQPIAWAAAEVKLPESVDSAFNAYINLPGKLVPILKKATDKESADKAEPELREALSSVYEARDMLHKMPALTPDQNQQVREVYGKKMRQEWALFYEETTRIRKAGCFKSKAFAQTYNLMNMMIEK